MKKKRFRKTKYKKHKIYKIRDSKFPTPIKMMKMAENLRTISRKHTLVRMTANAYKTSYNKFNYTIYIEDEAVPHTYYGTWPETIEGYRKLIRAKGDKQYG